MKRFILLALMTVNIAHAYPVAVAAHASVSAAHAAPAAHATISSHPAPSVARAAPATAVKSIAAPKVVSEPVKAPVVIPHVATAAPIKCDPKQDKNCKK